MDPAYQAALAGLANALPLPPRPLPPWAPTIPIALIQLLMSALLVGLAGLVAVECWLRVSTARGEGYQASIVSVTRQSGKRGGPGYLAYEYAFQDAAGVRRTERASAPVAEAAQLEPGRSLRVWPTRSLLARLGGRSVLTESMRASHRAAALPIAGCGAVILIGALICAVFSQRSFSERRLLAEGELVRGTVVSTNVRFRLVKPRLVVVSRFSGPAGPVESRYMFLSGGSPGASSGVEPSAGDTVWVALRHDDPTRSVPWAFERRSAARERAIEGNVRAQAAP
ncbi:MAG: hypothetical protein ACRELZ_16295 [Candidatus Rokuibacteriota bacterium]